MSASRDADSENEGEGRQARHVGDGESCSAVIHDPHPARADWVAIAGGWFMYCSWDAWGLQCFSDLGSAGSRAQLGREFGQVDGGHAVQGND